MIEYVASGLLIGTLTLSGALMYQLEQKKRLNIALEQQSIMLLACNARVANLMEDKASDDSIDNIPDADLPLVPPHWLRPDGSTGEP